MKPKLNPVKIAKSIIYVFMLLIMFVVYITVNSEGIRILAPFFGTPLSQFPMPFIHNLDAYEGWRELDCAHLVVCLYYCISIYGCHQIGFVVVALDDDKVILSPHQRVVVAVCIAVVLIDGVLFYCGSTSRAMSTFSSGSRFSFLMLLLAIAYMIMLLIIGHWGASLMPHKKESS
jgi:hypothetical protein